MREPRVWAAPPEPGPEVRQVRDRYGRRWLRECPAFRTWAIVPGPHDGPYRLSWTALFYELGPLTEEMSTVA